MKKAETSNKKLTKNVKRKKGYNSINFLQYAEVYTILRYALGLNEFSKIKDHSILK